MKIFSWNCNRNFAPVSKNVSQIFDVIILQECKKPSDQKYIDNFEDFVWVKSNSKYGICILTTDNSISIKQQYSNVNVAITVNIDDIILTNIWTKNAKRRYADNIKSLMKNIERTDYLCGDLNISNQLSQHKNSYDFNDTISDIHKLDLKSAYHNISGDDFGEENEGTYWSKVHKNFYHTDYIFTNTGFDNFSIGSINYWIGTLGDHRPLMITTK